MDKDKISYDEPVEQALQRMKNVGQELREKRIKEKLKDPNLFCYACAHSAATEPFLGKPSGERPCFFCVRNKDREQWVAYVKKANGGIIPERHPANGFWYDGSKSVSNPQDNYCTTDSIAQDILNSGKDPDTTIVFG